MSGGQPGVRPWRRLGDILVEEFALPAERLDAALAVQAVKGLRLGATLVEMKALGAENLARALARQFDLPFLAALPENYFEQSAPGNQGQPGPVPATILPPPPATGELPTAAATPPPAESGNVTTPQASPALPMSEPAAAAPAQGETAR